MGDVWQGQTWLRLIPLEVRFEFQREFKLEEQLKAWPCTLGCICTQQVVCRRGILEEQEALMEEERVVTVEELELVQCAASFSSTSE